MTPELCVPGYDFRNVAGTEWILTQPDEWMSSIQSLTRDGDLTLFLSHPERDLKTGFLYNSIFVIGPNSDILGVYRKIKVTGGAESWSTPGEELVVVDCGGIKVGLLICADAWFPELAGALKFKARTSLSRRRPGLRNSMALWTVGSVAPPRRACPYGYAIVGGPRRD